MDLVEKALSAIQRRKRATKLKARQSRLQQQRARKRELYATSDTLRRRAFKLARTMVRERVAGKGKGTNYSKLSVPQRIAIDTMLDKQEYKARIKRLASMLMPVVRRTEMTRMSKVKSGKRRLNSSFEHDTDLTVLSEQSDKLLQLLQTSLRDKSKVLLYKRILSDLDNSAKFQMYRTKIVEVLEKLVDIILKDDQIFNRVQTNLKKDKLDEACWKGYKVPKEKKWKKDEETGKLVPNCIPIKEAKKNKLPREIQSVKTNSNSMALTNGDNDVLQKEEHGAGEIGTNQLVKRYTKMTPGQTAELIKRIVSEHLEEATGASGVNLRAGTAGITRRKSFATRKGTRPMKGLSSRRGGKNVSKKATSSLHSQTRNAPTQASKSAAASTGQAREVKSYTQTTTQARQSARYQGQRNKV